MGLARAFHNSAVANARAQRRKRVPRALRLAGHRVVPRHFDIDDDALDGAQAADARRASGPGAR